MDVRSIKTHKITSHDTDLFAVLDKYVGELPEGSVLAITSKIVSFCEGSMVSVNGNDKDELIRKESQYFLPRDQNPYNVSLTITRNNLVATAGIDESNGNGDYILWPKDPQKTADAVREYLAKRFNVQKVGVIITDSKTTPFRWGVTAFAIAHSGFKALNDYTGKPDIFGRPFEFEKLNIADSFATSAGLLMGEGSEQTPLAVITDVPFIEFQDRNPTEKELEDLRINIDSDLYSPIIAAAKWQKGDR